LGDIQDKKWPMNIKPLPPEEPDRPDAKPPYVVPTIVDVDVQVPVRGKYKTANKKALGCVVHYTAGRYEGGKPTAISTLRYLASKGLGCLILDQDGVIYKAKNQGWDDYAYHAGTSSWLGKSGISQYCMGMEIMNAGLLETKRNQDGDYVSWFGQAIAPPLVRESVKKENIRPGAYHKFTLKQEEA
jgi:hypothetical protein